MPKWRGRGTRLIVLTALGGLLFVLSTGAGQPLYDGIGFPDDPYRYVVQRSGAPAQQPPSGASGSAPMQSGRTSRDLVVTTDESGPQAVAVLPAGTARGDGAEVRVRLTPLAAPARLPGAEPLGNTYRVSLDGSARVSGALVQLRVPDGVEPPVVLLRRDGDRWVPLDTRRVGLDVYAATFPVPGEVVAAQVRDASRLQDRPPAARLSTLAAVAVAFCLSALLLVAVVLLRRRTRVAGSAAGASKSPP